MEVSLRVLVVGGIGCCVIVAIAFSQLILSYSHHFVTIFATLL